jgi:hypothetical protein
MCNNRGNTKADQCYRSTSSIHIILKWPLDQPAGESTVDRRMVLHVKVWRSRLNIAPSKVSSYSLALFLKEKTVQDNLLLAKDNPVAAEKQRQIRLMTTKKDVEGNSKSAGDWNSVLFHPTRDALKDFDATMKAEKESKPKPT